MSRNVELNGIGNRTTILHCVVIGVTGGFEGKRKQKAAPEDERTGGGPLCPTASRGGAAEVASLSGMGRRSQRAQPSLTGYEAPPHFGGAATHSFRLPPPARPPAPGRARPGRPARANLVAAARIAGSAFRGHPHPRAMNNGQSLAAGLPRSEAEGWRGGHRGRRKRVLGSCSTKRLSR